MPTSPRRSKKRWDAKLVCHVRGLNYDFERREGSIYFPTNNCCDMGGCIDLFKRIDPEVRRIQTFMGRNRDTLYILTGDGWIAKCYG